MTAYKNLISPKTKSTFLSKNFLINRPKVQLSLTNKFKQYLKLSGMLNIAM